MKKIFFTCLLLSTLSVFSQKTYTFTLMDSTTGMPAVNHYIAYKFDINSINPIVRYQSALTDSAGQYTINFSGPSGTYAIYGASYDCNRNYVYTDTIKHAYPGNVHRGDTLYLACQPEPELRCHVPLKFALDTTAAFTTIISMDTSDITGLPRDIHLFFNDWSVAALNPYQLIDTLYANGQSQITYTFPRADTFLICTNLAIWDSTLLDRVCFTNTCDTLIVPFHDFCETSFTLDTPLSSPDTLYLRTTTTPSSPFFTNSYHWDFGDGDTSNQAYPTHVYDTSGVYEVCLTLTSVDGYQATCTNVFCDTLGVDSLGQIIYKSSNTGFVLNVINPATFGIGLPETYATGVSFEVFPNPASDKIHIKSPEYGIQDGVLRIYSLGGKLLLEKGVLASKLGYVMDVSSLPEGMFLLSFQTANGILVTKRVEVVRL